MGNAAKRLRREKKQKAAKTTRIVLITLSIVLALALIGALIFALLPDKAKNSDSGKSNESTSGSNTDTTPATDTGDKNFDRVTLNVSYADKNGNSHTGDIVIELRDDCAPITVANFKKLVSEGYYDGTEFFRIIDGMMIQGGENSERTADYIKGEFSDNGIKNPLSHVRGTVSMARRGSYYDGVPAYDSASAGFFIVQKDYPYWDGQYAAFGTVVEGMEHVDAIAGTELVYSETYGSVVAPKYPAIINHATLAEAGE